MAVVTDARRSAWPAAMSKRPCGPTVRRNHATRAPGNPCHAASARPVVVDQHRAAQLHVGVLGFAFDDLDDIKVLNLDEFYRHRSDRDTQEVCVLAGLSLVAGDKRDPVEPHAVCLSYKGVVSCLQMPARQRCGLGRAGRWRHLACRTARNGWTVELASGRSAKGGGTAGYPYVPSPGCAQVSVRPVRVVPWSAGCGVTGMEWLFHIRAVVTVVCWWT